MFYISLSTISLIGKSFIFRWLLSIYNESQLHKLLCLMLCCLIIGGFFEISLYYFSEKIDSPFAYWSLIGSYICLFYSIGLLPFIVLATVNIRFPNWLLIGVIFFIVVITLFLIFSRSIIADIEYVSATGSITRVVGPYYFIFQMVFIVFLSFCLFILIHKSFASNYFVRVRSRNLLIAFIPTFLFGTCIIIVMAMGVKFNAVGILSFFSLIYFFAMVHNLQPNKQPDYLVFFPFTKKNKILIRTLNQLVYMEPGVSKKTLTEQLIDYYLSQTGLTQKEVAELLNVSEATLSRRKKQLMSSHSEVNE